MTETPGVGRQGDRLLSKPRPSGSGTAASAADRALRVAARFRKRPRGFTMVEAAFSVVLVGGLVVVSLNTLGASRMAQRSLGDHAVAQLLASALLSEVLNLRYAESGDSTLLGVDLGENSLTRFSFDDVDDYANWCASPPQNLDGTVIPGLNGWRRCVSVAYANPAYFSVDDYTDSGVKRITVTIAHDNVVVATLVGLKTGKPNTGLVSDH